MLRFLLLLLFVIRISSECVIDIATESVVCPEDNSHGELFSESIREVTYSQEELKEAASRVENIIARCATQHVKVCHFEIVATRESRKIITAELRKRFTLITYSANSEVFFSRMENVPDEGTSLDAVFDLYMYG